jgi:hypothetical protein
MIQKLYFKIAVFLVFTFLLNSCIVGCKIPSGFETPRGQWTIESIINEQNILPEKLSSLEKGTVIFGDVNYQWKISNGNVVEEGTYIYDTSSSQVGTQATNSFIFSSKCTFETTITTSAMTMTYIDNQGRMVIINLVKQ